MKTLIGYDDSESANAALKDLMRAGLPSEFFTKPHVRFASRAVVAALWMIRLVYLLE